MHCNRLKPLIERDQRLTTVQDSDSTSSTDAEDNAFEVDPSVPQLYDRIAAFDLCGSSTTEHQLV